MDRKDRRQSAGSRSRSPRRRSRCRTGDRFDSPADEDSVGRDDYHRAGGNSRRLPALQRASRVQFPGRRVLPVRQVFAGLGAGLVLAIYDYFGYYTITYVGDEVRDPDVPWSIILAI